jgi:hypothetical protein
MAVDDLTILQSDSAQLQNLEMHGDLSSSLNFAATIRSDMDEQSRVPAVALGRQADLPKGNISGVALTLMFQPLIEKTIQKQRHYGKLIREITRAALVIAEMISLDEYEAYPIELHWQPLLPSDDLQAAQTALVLSQLGISSSTLIQNLGFNPDDEAAKSDAEQARKVTNFAQGRGLPPSNPQQQSMQNPSEQQMQPSNETPSTGGKN